MVGPLSSAEPGSSRPRHDFDAIYETGTPPWDIGRPQTAFQRLAETGALSGTVLDVGCGTGEHALLAASFGLDAVGVDIAAGAIARAEAKAAERNLRARFLTGDARRLDEIGDRFDTVLDCGLFHVFDDDDRGLFVESLSSVVPAGGRYHMLCFSERQPGDWGPRRITREQIRASLASGWDIDSIAPTVIAITLDPAGAQAWQVAATRR
jgi:SAM-dependent methyltransferase